METRIALRAQKSQRRRQPNLAMKFRRPVKGHFSRNSIRRNVQEATDNTKSEVQRANEKSRVR